MLFFSFHLFTLNHIVNFLFAQGILKWRLRVHDSSRSVQELQKILSVALTLRLSLSLSLRVRVSALAMTGTTLTLLWMAFMN